MGTPRWAQRPAACASNPQEPVALLGLLHLHVAVAGDNQVNAEGHAE